MAAFVGGELRGKAKVIYSKGKAYVALIVNVDGATNTATFKIYDASADAELTAALGGESTVVIVPAGTIGSGDSPVTITTSTGGGGYGDLPFTAVDFGDDADRLAKWRHSQSGITIGLHYRESETGQSGNSAIRKLVITSAGSAEIDLVNTPDWNLFQCGSILDRAYHVGTDGSTMVVSHAKDCFQLPPMTWVGLVTDIAQQTNNRGRLALGNGFSTSGVWEFISDEAIQVCRCRRTLYRRSSAMALTANLWLECSVLII